MLHRSLPALSLLAASRTDRLRKDAVPARDWVLLQRQGRQCHGLQNRPHQLPGKHHRDDGLGRPGARRRHLATLWAAHSVQDRASRTGGIAGGVNWRSTHLQRSSRQPLDHRREQFLRTEERTLHPKRNVASDRNFDHGRVWRPGAYHSPGAGRRRRVCDSRDPPHGGDDSDAIQRSALHAPGGVDPPASPARGASGAHEGLSLDLNSVLVAASAGPELASASASRGGKTPL
mmetsp:Transcript_27850/g.64787  ORF Transcript_27850/g.64787 Transcript_27850/m.64787 type:complete len:232 (+) Transcript_27850:632-1327(+)